MNHSDDPKSTTSIPLQIKKAKPSLGRNLNVNLTALDRIYDIYSHYAASLNIICKKGCTECCTRNVTMTTLEGYKIVSFLMAGRTDLLSRIVEAPSQNRFIPQLTTNGLADLCIEGKEPPEETASSLEEKCVFLEGDECAIYAVRPFGCRCMVSEKKCSETGFASVDPFTMTVSTVLLQYIEHIDANGFFANLIDILMFMKHPEGKSDYELNNLMEATLLIKNRPIPMLMIPPEHRKRAEPILKSLSDIPL